MRIPLGAIGAVQTPAACGDNPCTWWDDFWVSDECQSYLACAGLPPMTFSAQLAAGFKSVTSGAANVAAAGVSGAVSNPITTSVVIGALVIAGVIFVAVKK